MTEAFDIFSDVNDLLQVLILPVVKNWIVDDDAVDDFIVVGRDDGIFDIVLVYEL